MDDFLVTDNIYRDFIIGFDVNLAGARRQRRVLPLLGRETLHEPSQVKKHSSHGTWNTVTIQIRREPARIRFRLNGVAITDCQHTAKTTSGVSKEGRVRFRDIRLTEL